MARIVQTITKPKYGFKIVNHSADGISEEVFYNGDEVSDFKYIKDGNEETISGKIVDIIIRYDRATLKLNEDRKSYFTTDAKVIAIFIDNSKEEDGSIVEIKTKQLADYLASEGFDAEILATVNVDFEATLSDGTSSKTSFYEGQTFEGMTIHTHGIAITKDFTLVAFVYKRNPKGVGEIYGLVLNDGENDFAFNFMDIEKVGVTPIIIDDPEEAAEILSNITEDCKLDIKTNVEISSTIQIPEGVKVTINLNDNAILVPEPINNRSIYAIDNYGDLTIDGGTISARGIENFGTMTINDIDITNRDTNGGAAVWNEGDLVINGGLFQTTYEGTVQASSGPGCLNNRGNCTINKGTFKSVNNRCYTIISSGDIDIPDGTQVTINGAHGGLAIDSGHAVINGGVYTSANFYGLYVSNDGTGTPEKAQVIVNGGEFTGKVTSVYIGSDSGRPVDSVIDINDGTFNNKLVAQANVVEGAGIKVYGGKFKEAVQDNYCASGYACTPEPEEDGYYRVLPINEIPIDDKI